MITIHIQTQVQVHTGRNLPTFWGLAKKSLKLDTKSWKVKHLRCTICPYVYRPTFIFLIIIIDYPKKQKLAAEETLPPSIPLVTHDQHSKSIVMNQDAIKLLSTITKPVAVLGICGPYRTGKSYFVSKVLGGDDFEVSHSNDPCTKGIWMSTSVLEFDDHVLIVLDTEGTGAAQASESSSREEVMSILILTTLLSSCLIYNTKGTIKESDVQEMRYEEYLYQDEFRISKKLMPRWKLSDVHEPH